MLGRGVRVMCNFNSVEQKASVGIVPNNPQPHHQRVAASVRCGDSLTSVGSKRLLSYMLNGWRLLQIFPKLQAHAAKIQQSG